MEPWQVAIVIYVAGVVVSYLIGILILGLDNAYGDGTLKKGKMFTAAILLWPVTLVVIVFVIVRYAVADVVRALVNRRRRTESIK